MQSKMLTSIKQHYIADMTEDEIEAMVGLMYDGFSSGIILSPFKQHITDINFRI